MLHLRNIKTGVYKTIDITEVQEKMDKFIRKSGKSKNNENFNVTNIFKIGAKNSCVK